MKRVALFYIFIGTFFAGVASDFPLIQSMNIRDSLFIQYIEDVEYNYIALARGENVELSLYSYVVQEHEDLLSIAARANIRYESIAFLNHLAYVDDYIVGKKLLLPSCPGLFISETPITPIDFILRAQYFEKNDFSCYTIAGERFRFFQDGHLDSTSRSFFLITGMRSPLDKGVLTSAYGMRESPITGKKQFHGGIDIAASQGSYVYACKSGIVKEAGYSAVYGNYVLLQHDEKFQSLYGHLSTFCVQVDAEVVVGSKIGTVGSTGLSTGPHLHFEIRRGEHVQNPETVSPKFRY